jgi:hypothetical protein
MLVTVLTDEVRVVDSGSFRMERFDREGRAQGSEQMAEMVMSVPFRLSSEDEFLELRSPLMRREGEIQNDVLIRRTLAGIVSDTVLVLPGRLVRPREQVNAPETLWAVAGDMLLVAMNSDFRVEERSFDGKVARIFTLDVTPLPMSSARQEELLARVPERLRANATIHPNHPVIASMTEGPAGTVWIQTPVTSEPVAEASYEWQIFDSRGRFLGTLEMPSGFSARVVRHDRIYGVQRDDLGVQYVVRLRIEGL